MRAGDPCPNCDKADVDFVEGNAPHDVGHLQCPVCDSTYNITPAFAYDMKEQIDKLQKQRTDLRQVLAEMLGAAEITNLNKKSNVWRSLMITARETLENT
jgi:ssDNA-binding Zn-finger/Zn-ribbon topoisomerase 1